MNCLQKYCQADPDIFVGPFDNSEGAAGAYGRATGRVRKKLPATIAPGRKSCIITVAAGRDS
jgi:hypothetical protein